MVDKLVFETREDFRQWLETNGQTSGGVWLAFGKTKTFKTLSAHEALEEALCFGWIDGLINSVDEYRYIKYFSRRRKGSNWSAKNRALAGQLIAAGKMTSHGIAAVEEAKKNGEWEKVRDRDIPEDKRNEFEEKIRDEKTAFANYLSMAPSAQKQFIGFYFEAQKEETRRKRLEKIIGRLEQNKRLM